MNYKQILSAVSTYLTIGLSIYFIVVFFRDFEFVFIVCGVVVPLIAMLISSQYFAGPIFRSFLSSVQFLDTTT
jgi:hypothetical protein